MLNDALKFIRLGLAIVPLGLKFSGDKAPNLTGWSKNPFRNEDAAKAYWLNHPKANFGILLGETSGVVAIDIDCNHGASPEMIKDFPRTVTIQTRNGFHLYFKWEPNLEDKTIQKPAEGKAWNQAPACLYVGGRQFVAPPSIIDRDNDGNLVVPFEYRFLSDAGGELSFEDCPLALLPEIWRPGNVSSSPLQQSQTPESNLPRPSPVYLPNTRHEMFVRTAVAMRSKGREGNEIFQALIDRNQKHAKPPKEQAEPELKSIVEWAVKTVKVQPKITDPNQETYVLPLGFYKDEFFYTSSKNRQVVCITSSSHTTNRFLSLQPLDFWKEKYPKFSKEGNLSVAWDQAASDLMEAAMDEGIFDDTRMRGAGCWNDKGKLVVHTGDRLFYHGQYHDINEIDSDYIYTLTKSYPVPPTPQLSLDEGRQLITACCAPSWEDKTSGILLAGAMAILRIAGALPWRPHIWVSGSSGQGKSTIYQRIIEPIAGKVSLKPTGRTTEPGLRQKLQNSSRPVIYDEAETNDPESAKRMKAVVEFFRLSSFETDATVMKGTSDGSGIEFRACSMGVLVSIRVNLTDQADVNRFAVLELTKHDENKKDEFFRKVDPINREFGDKIFTRAIKMYPAILSNMKIFEDVIAIKTNRRDGQQYGTLLAGYASLLSDTAINAERAMQIVELFPRFSANRPKIGEIDKDEVLCLERLLQTAIAINDGQTTQNRPIGDLIEFAHKNPYCDQKMALRSHGIDVEGDDVFISNNHVTLERIYDTTSWQKNWNRTLKRLQGATASVLRRIGPRPTRCVKIPITSIFE